MTHTLPSSPVARSSPPGSLRRRASLRVDRLEDRTVLDVGDTLATALVTGLGPGPGNYSMYVEALGDGAHGLRDVDLYRFQAGANTILTARSSPGAFGDAMDPLVRLFDSAGNQLLANDDYRTSRYGRLDYHFAAAGTYYLGVSGSPNATYNPMVAGSGVAADVMGAYGLGLALITELPVAADFGDDLFTSSWTNVYGFSSANGYYLSNARLGDGPQAASDVDMFVLYASAGTTVTIRTLAPYPEAAGADTYVRLFDLAGTELAANDDGPTEYGLYSYMTYTFGADDVYLLGVSGAGNTAYHPWFIGTGSPGDTGLYRLEILLGEIPSAPFADVGDSLFDALFLGAGGYVQVSQRLGDGAHGALDVDMYIIYAAAGETLQSMTARAPGGTEVDTVLRLFDATGFELDVNDDGGAARYSSLSYRFTRTDFYYLGVSGFPNFTYRALEEASGEAGLRGDYLLDVWLSSNGDGAGDGQAPGGGHGLDLVFSLLLENDPPLSPTPAAQGTPGSMAAVQNAQAGEQISPLPASALLKAAVMTQDALVPWDRHLVLESVLGGLD